MDQAGDQETKSVQADQPIYLDKHGRRLFGTSQPSAFALGHPWPPIATNLGKKQVVRSRQDSKDSAASFSGEPSAQVVYVPKNVSDIELALYWDRVPRLERFQTLTCPVHGDILGVRRPSSLPPSRRRPISSTEDHKLGGNSSSNGNHNNMRTKLEFSPNGNHNNMRTKPELNPPENQSMIPVETASIIAPEDEQREKEKQDENNNQTIVTAADKSQDAENSKGNHKDKNGKSECATMTPAPVKVTTTQSTKTADKQIQIPDKDLISSLHKKTSPTFFCPLHGSYLNGIRRRNTPRFRTILLKDQEVQVDQQHLQITSAAPCGRNHEGRSRTVDIHGARKVGNVYSKKNTVAFRNSSARRNREHSEYEINYRNPKIVAESDRLNRIPFIEENKRLVRSKSSYLRR